MTEACAACGEDDDLLFTCQHCAAPFCSSHQFPHHACEGSSDGPPEFGPEWITAAEPEPDRAESPEDVAAILGGPAAEGTRAERQAPIGQAPSVEPRAARAAEGGDTPDGGTDDTTGTGDEDTTAERGTGTAAGSDTAPETSTEPPAPKPLGTTTGESGAGGGTAATRSVGVVATTGEPGTVGEWLDRQSYPAFLLKVGIIAVLINGAFYGGVALTLYDLLGLGF